jgi:hypothetical protein
MYTAYCPFLTQQVSIRQTDEDRYNRGTQAQRVHLEDACTALQYTYFNCQPDETSYSLFAVDSVLQYDF